MPGQDWGLRRTPGEPGRHQGVQGRSVPHRLDPGLAIDRDHRPPTDQDRLAVVSATVPGAGALKHPQRNVRPRPCRRRLLHARLSRGSFSRARHPQRGDTPGHSPGAGITPPRPTSLPSSSQARPQRHGLDRVRSVRSGVFSDRGVLTKNTGPTWVEMWRNQGAACIFGADRTKRGIRALLRAGSCQP